MRCIVFHLHLEPEHQRINMELDGEFSYSADDIWCVCMPENLEVSQWNRIGEELSAKAKEYMHLTSTQAGNIAKAAKAKNLYLVHISERYEKNSNVLLQQARRHFKNSFLPKDLDSVEV